MAQDTRPLKFWSPSVSGVQRLTKAVRLKDCRINWYICLWCILLSTKHFYGQQSLRSQSCSVSRLEESTTNNPPLALLSVFGCCRGDSHSTVYSMLKEKYSSSFWFTTSCWFSHILIPSGPNSSWKQDVHLVVYYRCRSVSLLGTQEKILLVFFFFSFSKITHTTAALWYSQECNSWGLNPPSTQMRPPPSEFSSFLYLSRVFFFCCFFQKLNP